MAWLHRVRGWGRRSSSVPARCAAELPALSACLLSACLLSACLLSACLLSACNDEQCEAERLQLTQTWETLRNTATSRKQIPEGSDLSKTEQDDRIKVWTDIEDRAELIRSSFQTPQVTIEPALKARAELEQLFKPLASNEDPMTRGFAVTLADADKRLESFRQNCR
jgi:hypothetical protein